MNEIEQKETDIIMEAFAGGIDTKLKEISPDLGFALIVFKFNEPGIGNYISNGKREDMITALREAAERLENKEDIPAGTGGA